MKKAIQDEQEEEESKAPPNVGSDAGSCHNDAARFRRQPSEPFSRG